MPMLVEDVLHDRLGGFAGDEVVADVPEVVVAAFVFPEGPGDVGPAVERGNVAVVDFLAGRDGLFCVVETGFDLVAGASDVGDEDGGDGWDEPLVVMGFLFELHRHSYLSWLLL